LRILHLIPNFTGGGAERQLALLAPELCRLGLEVHIAFGQLGVNSEANLDLISRSDIKLHRIPSLTNYDPTILLRILRVIRLVRPDLIQTWILQMDVLGGLAAILAGVPFVLSERSSTLMYPRTWKYWLRTQVGQRASSIIANSEGGAAYWKPRTTRIAVIRNGLSLDLIKNASPADLASLGFPTGARLILFAGRFSAEKNIDVLVRALDKVLVEKMDCIALLFGAGELQSNIQSRVGMARARDRIRLLGYTNELWSWMRRASAFLSISRFEGNPNAVLEAMAIGCPLVVSDIPQHREILDDSTALFCDPNSVEDVAVAISKALSNPAAAAARAEVARQKTTEWSVKEAAGRYFQLYNTVLSEREA
jgi:glycosyltransferase involved in cell wall biosynthesis